MPRKPNRVTRYAIRAIVEFYPLTRTDSTHGHKQQILDVSKPRMALIKKELRASHGIYIFYNSQGRAIYLGRADKRSLWGELNDAFNRKRNAQTIWMVKHPRTGKAFLPDQKRPIKKRKVFLHQIASFVSVYEVGDRLISNLEALLMRAFPNELTNARMESICYDRT
jgi:hypothetical protein